MLVLSIGSGYVLSYPPRLRGWGVRRRVWLQKFINYFNTSEVSSRVSYSLNTKFKKKTDLVGLVGGGFLRIFTVAFDRLL